MLNLPTKVTFEGTNKFISYLYTATGQKVQKLVRHQDSSSITKYLHGFQYYDNVLQFWHHPEGYVKNTPDINGNPSFDYVYQYRDHLGNVRVNYAQDPQTGVLEILEENHYYPFGLQHANYNTDWKEIKREEENNEKSLLDEERPHTPVANRGYQYKFNGKEHQEEFGINVYDFGFRNYDPALGRWMNIDPHAENYYNWSPYNYVGSNPIIRVDPDGKDWDIVINHDNQTITIRGNFTTLSGNENTLQEAADNWNAQSGKFSYVIGKGDDAISYVINFEISVNSPSEDVAENNVQIFPDDHKYFEKRTVTWEGGELTIENQAVSDGKSFALKESQKDDSQKTAHEMGHNLGMNHSRGLMSTQAGKNLSKKSMKETLGHSGVGKGVKGSRINATLQSKTIIGTAPENFQGGNLKRNRDWQKTKFN